MNQRLCQTFQEIAHQTFDMLGRARSVEHQPLEETLTDINILELKTRHGREIFSENFNKKKEGANGADWEWWLTNESMNSWLGLRVQAKIINFKSNSFKHIHYYSKKSAEYQLNKLKRASFNEGLIPLYCLFTHQFAGGINSARDTQKSLGCALVSVEHIESLLSNHKADDYQSVMEQAIPWEDLVCSRNHRESDLPTRAWYALNEKLKIRKPRKTKMEMLRLLNQMNFGIRSNPPEYVLSVINRQWLECVKSGVNGILVIREGRDE
jgi:hypothetical protein